MIAVISKSGRLILDDVDSADDLAYSAGVADGYYRVRPMAQPDNAAYVDGYEEGARMLAAEFGR